jgi:hypothetical protein
MDVVVDRHLMMSQDEKNIEKSERRNVAEPT